MSKKFLQMGDLVIEGVLVFEMRDRVYTLSVANLSVLNPKYQYN